MYVITETSKKTGYVWYVVLNVDEIGWSDYQDCYYYEYSYSVTDEIEDATKSKDETNLWEKLLDLHDLLDQERNDYALMDRDWETV